MYQAKCQGVVSPAYMQWLRPHYYYHRWCHVASNKGMFTKGTQCPDGCTLFYMHASVIKMASK